jgi:hypothetical protein
MLATGVFQLTFLLACFSIMVSAETGRAVSQASTLLKVAKDKLEQARILELATIETQIVLDQPADALEQVVEPNAVAETPPLSSSEEERR